MPKDQLQSAVQTNTSGEHCQKNSNHPLHTAYLGIGSNLGNRSRNIHSALQLLGTHLEIVKLSRIYRTKPYGGVKQPDFINLAVLVHTSLEPLKLLDVLMGIEKELGRERTLHWGPRTLDLDILLYDNLIYQDSQLTIPHVDLQNRDFVLQPLCDLAPELIHPLIKRSLKDLLSNLPNPS